MGNPLGNLESQEQETLIGRHDCENFRRGLEAEVESEALWRECEKNRGHKEFISEEAKETKADLLYNEENWQQDGRTVTAMGVVDSLWSDPDKDFCDMLCVTRDEDLGERTQSADRCLKYGEVNPLDLSDLGLLPSCDEGRSQFQSLVFSHPHGKTEKITVGHATCEGEGGDGLLGKYNTPTCPGSIGAPVFVFGPNQKNLSCLPRYTPDPSGSDTTLISTEHESQLNYGKTNKSKCLSRLALALSVTSLAVVLALGVFVVLTLGAEQSQPQEVFGPETTEEEMAAAFACIPCKKLLSDPAQSISTDPLLRNLDIEVNNGTENCCAYTPEQKTALFQSLMRLSESPPQKLPSFNASDFNFSPVSAHKRLYPERVSLDLGVPDFPQRPQMCKLKADDTRSGLEHHRGVNITEQGLRIVYGGLYYIYSSIQFRPQSTRPCREFRYQTFVAYVEKISYRLAGAQAILKSIHTCCDKCVNTQETSYSGGVFVLEPGDLVRVKVMGYELVHFQPETSFLGLAMLGSANFYTH